MRQSRRVCLALLAWAGSGLMSKQLRAATRETMTDFTDPDIAGQMRIVNDDVMGGQSASRVLADPQGLVFSGVVSLENNGGFASVRCPAQFAHAVSVLELSARGDGQRYQLIMRTELATLVPLYKCSFVAAPDWKTHQFQTRDFDAAIRGRPVAAPPLIFSKVKEWGIMIADKQSGGFRLQLRSLRAR